MFRILREGGNTIHLALDILQDQVYVSVSCHFRNDTPVTFCRNGFNLLDAVNPGQVFLNLEDNPFFNLFRTGARISHANLNPIKGDIREDFLFDAEAHDHPANDQHQHQQIGSNVILRHPANSTVH